MLLRSCTVVLTIKRWDAPRPVSLTRGFKGHTPFIRPVFETASAASCLCHQVRLGLLSGWTMNAWSRFARQKEERTSSALTRRFELRTTTPTASYCGNPSAPCLKAPEIIPSHAQAAARPPTHNSGGGAARLYSLCSADFSATRPTKNACLLLRRRRGFLPPARGQRGGRASCGHHPPTLASSGRAT